MLCRRKGIVDSGQLGCGQRYRNAGISGNRLGCDCYNTLPLGRIRRRLYSRKRIRRRRSIRTVLQKLRKNKGGIQRGRTATDFRVNKISRIPYHDGRISGKTDCKRRSRFQNIPKRIKRRNPTS